ncbi:HAD family phosphatase [Sinobaca sp. H24]|uniref:HAD family hydrolase n=1 Tax=Sinobaca sp. H24 TaxID=2923376 RepID=UPI00207AECAF|nr:HAD family hydrolase [Sinobaca sp. H24]
MIKGVIFDFDGLILDTETHQYEAMNTIYKEHGHELPLALWQEQIGTYTGFRPFSYLEEQLQTPLEHEALEKRLNETFVEKLSSEQPRPGVHEYLQAASHLNLKVGLASSSDYSWVSRHLRTLGLYDHFETINTKDDVEIVKPDPTLYQITAEQLGLSPEECLVFEDSANGALAARRAGMACVVFPNTVTKAMEFGEVSHQLESMADMELQELITYINEKA